MRVIIAAAGTAGHINPGIAIANKIKEEEPDSKIIFIGTGSDLEKDLTSRAGYELKKIDAYGFSKKISIDNIKKMIKTLKGFKEAKKIIREFKPDVVIGTGGYICGAVISSAHSLKIPTMLHESNAYPGLAVKMLAKKTDTILLGIKEAENHLKKAKKIVYTGNPTKVKKLNLSDADVRRIKREIKVDESLPLVLVFGGSQGARVINNTIVEIVKNKLNKNYQIVCAAGKEQYELVKQELEKTGIDINNIENTIILPYIYNMDEVMSIADLVVARSGAMTLTELAIIGKPAIFIPLPSSSANRQEDNARVFEKNGAAKVILNNELNENNLNKEINNIISNKEIVNNMGKAASKMAVFDAENRIYQEVQKLITIQQKN